MATYNLVVAASFRIRLLLLLAPPKTALVLRKLTLVTIFRNIWSTVLVRELDTRGININSVVFNVINTRACILVVPFPRLCLNFRTLFSNVVTIRCMATRASRPVLLTLVNLVRSAI